MWQPDQSATRAISLTLMTSFELERWSEDQPRAPRDPKPFAVDTKRYEESGLVRLPNPPALAVLITFVGLIYFWALDAEPSLMVATLACGLGTALFYAVVKPRRD